MTNKEKKQIITEMFEDNNFFVGEVMACNESRDNEDYDPEYNIYVIGYSQNYDLYDSIPLTFVPLAHTYDSNRDVVLDNYEDVYDALVLHDILPNDEVDI